MTKKKETKPEREHRRFYVDGVLQFAFYMDAEVTDPDEIMERFYDCRDWKSLSDYCEWKVDSHEFSEDNKRVDIKLKKVKKKK